MAKTLFLIHPSKNITTIRFANPESIKHSLIIYNSKGQTIEEINNVTDNEIKIDNRNWQRGMYFFKLFNDNNNIGQGKFIIE